MKNLIGRLFKVVSYFNDKKRTKSIWLLSFSIFFSLIILISYFVLDNAEKKARANTVNALRSTLNHSYIAIKDIWAKDHFIDAAMWASDPVLIQNTKKLLTMPRDTGILLNSTAMFNVRTYFKEKLLQHNYLGIFIISPDFVSIASMSDKNLGTTNFIVNEHKKRLKLVFEGYNQIIPPMPSDIPLPDKYGNLVEGYLTMFVIVPIKDAEGSIIAALSIRLDPYDYFTLMVQTTRIGTSGQTYIVNKEGVLLTKSRFLDQSYGTNILGNEEYNRPGLEVRGPGVDLLREVKPGQLQKEPQLTYAVEQVLKYKSGFSKFEYPDYKGVDVLGAWLWDDELDIGFISEIDEKEALQAYRNTRVISIYLLAITVLLVLILSYVNWKNQRTNIKTIEQKEQYFRTILNNAVSGIIIINEKGIIETYNLKAENIFGYKASEVIGKNVSMLANKNDRKHHDSYIQNFRATGIPKAIGLNKEVVGIRRDGSSFPLSLGVSEIILSDRRVFMGMIIDLTQEKEAEKVLYEIEERFSRTFDQASVSIVNMDMECRFQKVNQAFSTFIGYSEKELLSMGIEDIIFSDDIEDFKRNVKQLVDGKFSEFSLEGQYHKKSGRVIWGKASVSSLKVKSGEIKNLIAVIEDVTLRKNAEDNLKDRTKELELSNVALEKSKSAALSIMQDAHSQRERAEKALRELKVSNEELKKLNHAIEQSLATVVITDKTGKIEYVNPAFTKISGYTFEEALGHPPGILKSGKHSKKFYKDLWKTILAGKTWKGDFINKKKTGEEYWESASISPMFSKDGEITHFVGVKEDITERKLLEAELIKSKEEADSANKAKSEFLANMSHEIRTPMNAILGFSEILSQRIKDPSYIDYLTSIRSSGKTLLKLINDVLDLSKIESGKLDINYGPSNIRNLIQDVRRILMVKAAEKKLQLNVVISKDLPNVLNVDELRIKQILINLINNSIKFTEKGYIEVEATAANKSLDYLDLIIKVEDTGIGIPKKYSKKIFHAFDQVDRKDDKVYEGTGLGLAITQKLVKRMNGRIELKSEERTGSIFTIVLEKVKISNSEVEVEEKLEFDHDSIQFEKSSVLVVDDVKANRDVLKGYMSDYNITVIEAENGREAITAIEKHKPNLVFLDLRMPVMDGYEANRIIMKNPDLSHIPIIAITASAFSKDKKKVIDMGFSGYVRKPASFNDILQLLTQYIKHSIVEDKGDALPEVVVETIKKPEELLLEIDNKAMPVWEKIRSIRNKKKVLLLAGLLIEIGENYNVVALIQYGNELQLASQSFNVNKENKLIQQFPDFVKKLIPS